LRDAHPELERRGIAVAVVTFGDVEGTRRFCAARHVPFPCYADPERRAYDAFELERHASWHRVLDPRQAEATVRACAPGIRCTRGGCRCAKCRARS